MATFADDPNIVSQHQSTAATTGSINIEPGGGRRCSARHGM